MKKKSFIIIMLLLVGFGCSKDNTNPAVDTTDPKVDSTDPIVENPDSKGLKTININIELPAGSSFIPDNLFVSSLFTENNKVNNSKGIIKSFDDDSMELSFASNSQGNIVLLSYFDPIDNENIVMNAETTAIALVMLHPWTMDLTTNAKKEAIAYIKSLPEFNDFLNIVENSILSGEVNPLSTQNIFNKVVNIQNATVQKISKYIEPLQFAVENSTITVKNVISSASYSVGLYDNKDVLIEHKLVKGQEKSYYLFQEFKEGILNSTQSGEDIVVFNIPRDGKWSLKAKSGLSFDNTPENKEAAFNNSFTLFVLSSALISEGLMKLLKNSKCSITIGQFVYEAATDAVNGGSSIQLYANGSITGYTVIKEILYFFSNRFQSIKDIVKRCSPEAYSELNLLRSSFLGKVFGLIDPLVKVENAFNSGALLADWIQYDKEIDYCLLKNGNDISTCTEIPLLTTTAISTISGESAVSGGNISDDGGSSISARGICWGTAQNPTISGNKTSDGIGIGEFTSNMTGLEPNTLYYVRAYAINDAGTAYGEEITFNTEAPTISLLGSTYTLISSRYGAQIPGDVLYSLPKDPPYYVFEPGQEFFFDTETTFTVTSFNVPPNPNSIGSGYPYEIGEFQKDTLFINNAPYDITNSYGHQYPEGFGTKFPPGYEIILFNLITRVDFGRISKDGQYIYRGGDQIYKKK